MTKISAPKRKRRLEWTRRSFHIRLRRVPGLFNYSATEGIVSGSFGIHGCRGEWYITHVPSGRCACGAHTIADAKDIVRALKAIKGIDWTSAELRWRQNPDLCRQVKEIIE